MNGRTFSKNPCKRGKSQHHDTQTLRSLSWSGLCLKNLACRYVVSDWNLASATFIGHKTISDSEVKICLLT